MVLLVELDARAISRDPKQSSLSLASSHDCDLPSAAMVLLLVNSQGM